MKNTNDAAYSKKKVSMELSVDVCVASKEAEMHCNSASVVGDVDVAPSSEIVVRLLRHV